MRIFKNISIMLTLFSLFAFAEGDMEEKVRIQNMNVVKAAANELSKDLPKKVDRFTRLLSVSADGETLVYTFEIDAGPKSDEAVVEEGKERMKRNVTAGICSTSHRFLQSGIAISYKYISAATKRELFRFDVDKKTCESLR